MVGSRSKESPWVSFNLCINISVPYNHGRYRDIIVNLVEVEKLGGYCCGGFPRKLVINKGDFTDIDIFPISENKLNHIKEYFDYSNFFDNGESNPNSEYLPFKVHSYTCRKTNVRYQIVGNFGEPGDICERFDFTACQAYVKPSEGICIVSSEMLNSREILRFSRNFDRSKINPTVLLRRVQKYINKGYFPSVEVLMHLQNLSSKDLFTNFDEIVATLNWIKSTEILGVQGGYSFANTASI